MVSSEPRRKAGSWTGALPLVASGLCRLCLRAANVLRPVFHWAKSDRAWNLAIGMIVGGIFLATIQPALLAWGLSLPVLVSMAITVAAAAVLTNRLPTISSRFLYLVLAGCCFAQPTWLRLVAGWFTQFSTANPSPLVIDAMIGVVIVASVVLPIASTMMLAKTFLDTSRRSFADFLIGFSAGIGGQVLIIGPTLGIDRGAMALCCGLVGIAAILFWNGEKSGTVQSPAIPHDPPASGVANPSRVTVACICVAAGSLWCGLCHLAGDLMPVSHFVLWMEFVGLLLGAAVGLYGRASGSIGRILVALLGLSAVAFFPNWIDGNLSWNCSLSWVSFLMAARVFQVLAVTVPCGWLVGQVIGRRLHGRDELTAVAFTALGWTVFEAAIHRGAGIGSMLIAVCLTLGLSQIAANVWRDRSTNSPSNRWTLLLRGTAAVLLLLGPLARERYQPGRASKLLFSSSLAQAYQRGWKIESLFRLDDGRVLESIRGENGQITAIKQMGGRCYFRERGIPRGCLSLNPSLTPQAPYEVLQTVIPLILADNSDRVLILGAGSGTILHTALAFPTREVVVAEGNLAWRSLMSGPIKTISGADPLADNRVTWRSWPAPFAVRAGIDQFDVIISSPTSPLIAESQTEFTVEFYQDVARRLNDGGVFVQRLDAIDFGAWPIASAASSLHAAFQRVILMEAGAGELLLVATQNETLLPADLTTRIQSPQVTRVLGQCDWDWSMLLNLPAYEDQVVREISQECGARANTMANSCWSFSTIQEALRWGSKLQEAQKVLTKPRLTSDTQIGFAGTTDESFIAAKSRKSRWLEWIGDVDETPILLKRLEEVAALQQIVHDVPDGYWWEYRKSLKTKLQGRTRSALQQVNAIREETKLHPIDQNRKDYFVALGRANESDRPTLADVRAIEDLIDPYDPLLTLFAHSEIAQLYARGELDCAREMQHRLHAIYHAPASDVSIRNVIAALELAIREPESFPDSADRFDHLNSLLQILRQRWERRAARPCKSVAVAQQDIDRTIVTTEKAMAVMDQLVPSDGAGKLEWTARRATLFRLLITSLGEHRHQLSLEQNRRDQKKKLLAESLK